MHVLNKTNFIRTNPVYVMCYMHWTRLLFTGVIPFIYLTCLNILINKNIRKTYFQKASMKSTQNSIKTLVAILMLYFVCNIPR